MQYITTTNTELRPGKPVHLEIEAVFESQDSNNYTFRLANGFQMHLPKQQQLNCFVMWQGRQS